MDRLFRRESGRAIATLIGVLGDFDLAEEAVQDAFVVAIERWPSDGVPDNPGAWITRVARNKAIDRLRRQKALEAKRQILEGLKAIAAAAEPDPEPELHPDHPELADDRLRLIFTTCHPALAPESRIALTLRTLGGLTTAEIAAAFLSSESAIAQRLVRAKRKIRDAGIPYEVPGPERLAERTGSVLATLYLVFNEGYAASQADVLVRRELCTEAIRLARVLEKLLPSEPEAAGLLALMLLQDSRRDARVDTSGDLVLLADQERSIWDRDEIAEGLAIASRLMDGGPVGTYSLQAAIAAEHARPASSADTDWPRIVALYDLLVIAQPSPVVMLNRAAAVVMVDGPARGLELVDELEGLDDYQPLHAARADWLVKLGRTDEAANAYRRAAELSGNPVQRDFFNRRLQALE